MFSSFPFGLALSFRCNAFLFFTFRFGGALRRPAFVFSLTFGFETGLFGLLLSFTFSLLTFPFEAALFCQG